MSPELKTESEAISKEALVRMRKETGYSYVKCRKALVKFGTENYNDALRWINENAKKEGWEKAAKLSSRHASNGLCALMSNKNVSVMVALKCETDFVANSSEFKNLLKLLTEALHNYAHTVLNIEFEKHVEKKLDFIDISPKDFYMENGGMTAEEAIVSAIGKLGENITLNSAKVIFAHPSINVIGSTHPTMEVNNVQLGRFISIIALKRYANFTEFSTEKLGRQICHHIIGMIPVTLGEPLVKNVSDNEQKICQNKILNEMKADQNQVNEENDIEDNEEIRQEITSVDENETQLLRQAFMLNPQQTVHDYLSFHGAEVTDFLRFELENIDKKI